MRISSVVMCVVLGAGAAMSGVVALAGPPAKVDPKVAFEARLRSEHDELLSRVSGKDALSTLASRTDRLLDETIAFGIPTSDASLLRDVAALRRVVKSWGPLDGEASAALRKLLGENRELVTTVALAMDASDNAPNAYAVLRLLVEKYPERLGIAAASADAKVPARPKAKKGSEDLSNLVAAFCVTHDVPQGAKTTNPPGERPTAPPIDQERIAGLFDYFSTNASKMAFGPATPPALLAYIVAPDPRVTLEDLNWALKSQQGNRSVGKLYSTITYDTSHFKRNTPKKVEQAPGGLTLQNIRKFGGVCIEQAIFAANVGKAIGVPATVVVGRGSDVGHAWVGYLKSVGNKRWAWDFDEGRYDEYKDLRGVVTDPQSRRTIPDGYVGLTAGLIGQAEKLESSNALLDAAERLAVIETGRVPFPPAAAANEPTVEKPLAREANVKSRLELIELALRACPANRRGWEMVSALAETKKLSPEQLKVWSERIIEMCGREYPDFAFDALSPMIRAVSDPQEQDRLWDWAAGRFQSRKDLVATSMLWRGDGWQVAGQPTKAWEYYNDVIERYPNDGQIIVQALARGEKLLEAEKKPEKMVDLYKSAWSRVSRPKSAAGEFTGASTYVIVGQRYAKLLEDGGRSAEAKKVRDAVQQVLDK